MKAAGRKPSGDAAIDSASLRAFRDTPDGWRRAACYTHGLRRGLNSDAALRLISWRMTLLPPHQRKFFDGPDDPGHERLHAGDGDGNLLAGAEEVQLATVGWAAQRAGHDQQPSRGAASDFSPRRSRGTRSPISLPSSVLNGAAPIRFTYESGRA